MSLGKSFYFLYRILVSKLLRDNFRSRNTMIDGEGEGVTDTRSIYSTNREVSKNRVI